MRHSDKTPFLATEKRAIASLGLLYGFRMLGLFMLLPVLSLYATEFELSTPVLVGLALGIYGLSQALLQIPFGMLSDRVGRKPVIIAGLILFCIGSLVAASATTIWGVIIGRALQGSGAIASTVLALLSDLTREEQRTKAMAFIGMSIGLTFVAALLLGPWISAMFGIRWIFWLTAGLALFGLLIITRLVPTATRSTHFDGNSSAAPGLIGRVLKDSELGRLNLGIFALHFVLTACFVVLPLMLRDTLSLEPASHAWVYISILGPSFVAMVPLIILAERRRLVKQVFLFAIALLGTALLALSFSVSHGVLLLGALFFFFLAFNLLEANLPSLVSKLVFPAGKGTAMGVYSTFQFLGAFFGGVVGGWMMQFYGPPGVFAASAIITALWFFYALGMSAPAKIEDVVLEYDQRRFDADTLLLELAGMRGVKDVTLIAADSIAYLRVDESVFKEKSLQRFMAI